jgi:hypothetical protein
VRRRHAEVLPARDLLDHFADNRNRLLRRHDDAGG